jgi:hypothetical protein
MDDSKTLFSSSKFTFTRGRISSKFLDNLGTHYQKVRQACYSVWSLAVTEFSLLDIREMVERYRIRSPNSEFESQIFPYSGAESDAPELGQCIGRLEPCDTVKGMT